MLSVAGIDQLSNGRHHFEAVMVTSERGWLQRVAQEYARLRTQTRVPPRPVSVEGIGVVDTSAIAQKMREACIPEHTPDSPFDIVRSDFGETLATIILRQAYGTGFCYRTVCDRERCDLPGRGIDVIGVEEQGGLRLLLGEVKVSAEAGRKPRVVDSDDDSLSRQLVAHISGKAETSRKIWHALRFVGDPALFDRLAIAALYWDCEAWDRLGVVCCAILVRPRELYASRDFGHLLESPDAVAPASVRFLIVCFAGDLPTLLPEFRALAVEGGHNG